MSFPTEVREAKAYFSGTRNVEISRPIFAENDYIWLLILKSYWIKVGNFCKQKFSSQDLHLKDLHLGVAPYTSA